MYVSPRMRAWTLIAICTALWVSACSSGSKEPPLGPVPVVTSYEQIALPVSAYVPTADQVNQLNRALDLVDARCRNGFGLPTVTPHTDDAAAFAKRDTTVSVLYGFFDTGADTSKGYDRVRASSSSDGDSGITDADKAAFQIVETGVGLDGKPVTEYRGKAVPAGGCHAFALTTLGGPVPEPIVEALPDGGPRVARDDPRLAAATAQWAACMKAKGYAYPNPWSAFIDPRWVPESGQADSDQQFTHTAAEVATAQADVACKISTNYMGTVVALETTYGDRYIKAHVAALTQWKATLNDRVGHASRIIAGGGEN